MRGNTTSPGFPETEKIVIDRVSSAIIKTLAYFNIFHYPLTAGELRMHCQGITVSSQELDQSLKELSTQHLISEKQGYYFIFNRENLIERRMAGNKLAGKYLKKALRFSRLISRFPFVRGICISGSLSKGYMDKTSDIDYFIITAPKRLWICRTLLILFKKIFLLNSKKFFCVNYFIDTQTLEIPDQNLFTATELSFVIPVYNYPLYIEIMQSNKWINNYYPNAGPQSDRHTISPKSSLIKKVLENTLKTRLGEKIEKYCFLYTIKHWKKKFSHLSDDHFDLNLRSRKNTSKHHPQGFQWQILQQSAEMIEKFEQSHQITLS